MTDFALGHAADDDAQGLAHACVQQLGGRRDHTLGFLYVTDEVAGELGNIVEILKQGTGIADWVGTVGYGICASGVEYFRRPALVALTCDLPKDAYRLLATMGEPDEARASSTADGFAAGLGVVHGDPRNGDLADILSALAQARSAYLVGGLTSAEHEFLQVSNVPTEGGLSGVLLGGRLQVAMGVTQGCVPVGPRHTIDLADGQVVATLDGRPAFEVLLEDLGVAEGADPMPWLQDIHAALPVEGSNENDFLVRNLVGIEPNQGLVVIADEVNMGDRVMFVRRDAESAKEDLQRMLKSLKARLSQPPRAALYYSCVARGPNLFTGEAYELQAIAETFGDIPLAGFFGNGEIAGERLYAYTGVLTLFL